jgi:hypothetical protein
VIWLAPGRIDRSWRPTSVPRVNAQRSKRLLAFVVLGKEPPPPGPKETPRRLLRIWRNVVVKRTANDSTLTPPNFAGVRLSNPLGQG